MYCYSHKMVAVFPKRFSKNLGQLWPKTSFPDGHRNFCWLQFATSPLG